MTDPHVARTAPEAIEIRPKAGRNALLLGLACAAFTAAGVYLVVGGEDVFAGLLAIVFFGGGGAWATPKIARRSVTLALTPTHLEQRFAEGSVRIPWSDVESVGIVNISSAKMVGIRLAAYDGYLESMSPALAAAITRRLPVAKMVAQAASLLDAPEGAKLILKGGPEALKSVAEVRDLAGALLWSRTHFGYDLTLTWAELDRPRDAFVALLRSYLARGYS
jgi:hypothetical protein